MKIRNSRNEGRSPNPLLLSSKWSIGRRGLQIPIICIVLGLAVLYLGERSVASIFSSDSQAGTSLQGVEAYAAAALRSIWSSATGQAPVVTSAKAQPTQTAAAASKSSQNLANTSAAPKATQASTTTTLAAAPATNAKAQPITSQESSLTAVSAAPGASAVTPITNATINGTGWKGTTSSSWNTSSNWDNGANYPGTDERNLFFGQGYANAGGTGSLTANNDLVGYSGYRMTFEDIGSDSSAANDKSFTITGNAFTLFDFGVNNFPRIENDSFVTQTFSLGGTLTLQNNQTTGTGNNSAQINPVNGNIVINNAVDLAGITQLFIFGNTGHSVTFAGPITSSGNSNLNSIAISSNTDGRMPTMIVTGTGSTFGGGTFVNAGTLQLGLNSSPFTNGAISGTITLGDNNSGGGNTPTAQLLIAGSGGQTFSNTISVRAGSAGLKKITTSYSGSDTWSGPVNLDVPLTIDTGSSSTLTISGVVAGNAGGTSTLTKIGAGTLILSNSANTYTGTVAGTLNASGTQLSAGTLGITSDTSLGLAPSGAYNNIQFTGSATLQDTSNNITLNANRNISLASGVTATFDTNGNTFTIPGIVQTTSTTATNLVARGGGTLILQNTANTYTGATTTALGTTTITEGTTLGIDAATSLGQLPNAAFNSILFTGTGGTLQDTTNNITLGSQRGMNVANNANASFDSNGNTFTVQGVISGGGSARKIGNGTVVFSGVNNYTGGTTINTGTLQLSGPGTLGASSNTLTVNTGGTLDLNGDATNTSRTVGALNGTGGFIVNNNTGFFLTTFNVGQGDGTGSYAGSITNHTGSGNGFVALTKVGTGTETLTGNNSYTFGTTVSAGTLKLANTSGAALSGTSGVTINNGGTLLMGANNQINQATLPPITLGSASGAGTAKIDAGGFSQGTGGTPAIANSGTVGLGALTLNASSIIDLTGTSVLHFSNSSANSWIGTLSIYNWSGTPITGGGAEQILFGGDPTGLNTQLTQISFYSDNGSTLLSNTALILGDGEIIPGVTPVPEPATWFASILAFAMLSYTQRNRLSRKLKLQEAD